MNKTPKDCLEKLLPVRDALDVFQGKWKIQIISVLIYYEQCSFKLLKESVKGITPKMLSKELKDLEDHLLVRREVTNSRPLVITYHITEYGKTAAPIILTLYKWGAKHREQIMK